MKSEPLESKLNVQADPHERSKRERECVKPGQGNPHQAKSNRNQILKMRKTISGDTKPVQTGLAQNGFGPTTGDGIQRWSMEERQQPSLVKEKQHREKMPELMLTAALSATSGRESCAEGQDSAEAPRPTISQDYLLTLGEENRWAKMQIPTSQQESRAPGQPHMDLTRDSHSETLRPMRTLQHLDPDHQAATQKKLREAQ